MITAINQSEIGTPMLCLTSLRSAENLLTGENHGRLLGCLTSPHSIANEIDVFRPRNVRTEDQAEIPT